MEEKKSKSQVKREMTALQAMGERLVSLSPDQLARIEMPEDLREAVLATRTMTTHGARRRHMQYIGVLMRGADPEPIQEALDAIDTGLKQEAWRFKQAEDLRENLLGEDGERMEPAFLDKIPGTDRQRVRQLIRNARKERFGNKSPRSGRELFRYLREHLRSAEPEAGSDLCGDDIETADED